MLVKHTCDTNTKTNSDKTFISCLSAVVSGCKRLYFEVNLHLIREQFNTNTIGLISFRLNKSVYYFKHGMPL